MPTQNECLSQTAFGMCFSCSGASCSIIYKYFESCGVVSLYLSLSSQSQSQDHTVGAPFEDWDWEPLPRAPATEPSACRHHPCSPVQCPSPPLPPAPPGPDSLPRNRGALCRMGPDGDVHVPWWPCTTALPSLGGVAAWLPPILQLYRQSCGTG